MLLMPNYAAQHKTNVEAAGKPAVSTTVSAAVKVTVTNNELSLFKIRLAEDLRKISGIRSKERANNFKRSVLEHYFGYCSAVISRNEFQHNVIIVRVCIWCFDIGEFSKGLLLAEYALSSYLTKPDGYRHTLAPEGFKRNLAEVLTENLSDHVLKSNNPNQYVAQLEHLLDLVRLHDMNDYISSKLHRAYALALGSTNPDKAIKHYTESLNYRPLASIHKAIKRLENLKNA